MSIVGVGVHFYPGFKEKISWIHLVSSWIKVRPSQTFCTNELAVPSVSLSFLWRMLLQKVSSSFMLPHAPWRTAQMTCRRNALSPMSKPASVILVQSRVCLVHHLSSFVNDVGSIWTTLSVCAPFALHRVDCSIHAQNQLLIFHDSLSIFA